MSDIVERLRSRTSPLTRVRELSPTAALCREAAAEIERLRNVVQSMKEPMKCECGFTVEVCATNLCMRKKVHSAGLTPGSKWPEPAPIRNRIKDTATSHEAKPFMMLSCREAGRCLHNLPGCICEVDPCYDVDLRLSAGNANVREALELAEDVLSRAPFSTGIWPNGMHPQTGIDKIRDAIRSLGEPQEALRYAATKAVEAYRRAQSEGEVVIAMENLERALSPDEPRRSVTRPNQGA